MKVVTVHRGARDYYQVARALHDAALLDKLVTDLHCPARFSSRLPGPVRHALEARSADGLPSNDVYPCSFSGAFSIAAEKFRALPFSWRSAAVRWCDHSLGSAAARIAARNGSALLSYSYYAYSAFSRFEGSAPRILFQLHPHPASVRAILHAERTLHPDCATSLDSEWELALPDSDFRRLCAEPAMAQHWIVASRFTADTLSSNGIPANRIAVVPYGVDADRFLPKPIDYRPSSPLKVLFVGTIGQRKGIKYLLDAAAAFPRNKLELTICGRPVDDLSLLRTRDLNLRVFAPATPARLLQAYREADVFVFPSLAEGFGHVLLEAMASGLPILATTRTAAPDLIRHGVEGFIVPPGNSNALIEHLERHLETWLRNPRLVADMGRAARTRAVQFSWARFRHDLASRVASIVNQPATPTHRILHQHV